jgi:hypothetical protein
VDDHRNDGHNYRSHEQVRPNHLVVDNIVETYDHDLLLKTILSHAVSRPTNVLQPGWYGLVRNGHKIGSGMPKTA